jgi:hypothetical protein
MEETNALGTTYLRAGILPRPDRTEIRNLLREYLDVRVRAVQSGQLPEGLVKPEGLQNRL